MRDSISIKCEHDNVVFIGCNPQTCAYVTQTCAPGLVCAVGGCVTLEQQTAVFWIIVSLFIGPCLLIPIGIGVFTGVAVLINKCMERSCSSLSSTPLLGARVDPLTVDKADAVKYDLFRVEVSNNIDQASNV